MKSLYSFLSRVNSASNVKLSASAATNPTENLFKKFILRTAGVVALLLVFGGSVKGQTVTVTNPVSPWSVPANVTSFRVEVWGGGGAGGYARANSGLSAYCSGGGGGGGSYARSIFTGSLSSTYNLSVGAATAVTGSTTSDNTVMTGSNGNPSWFGSNSILFAPGGNGGFGRYTDANVALSGAGGAALTSGAIGEQKFYGGAGASGVGGTRSGGGGGSAGSSSNGNSASSTSTSGGAAVSGGGAGANGRTNYGVGGSASGVGGGGAGGNSNSTTFRLGGQGAAGQIIISYIIISSQPANTSACSGAANATFTVVATGATSWQWQEFNGTTWSNITNGGIYSDATTATLTLTNPTTAVNGYKYRCLVNGVSYTDGNATLTVNALPNAVTVTGGAICSGGTISASGGTGGTIYWQGTTTGGTSTSIGSGATSPAISTAGTYYARSQSAEGCWGTQGSAAVTITPIPSCIASGFSPADGNTSVNPAVGTSITWTAVANATSYDVYFGTSSTPGTYVNQTATSYSTSTFGTLEPGVQYYWQVIPKNSCGAASNCSVYSFTTTSACTAPTISSTSNVNILCFNQSTGSITVNATEGTVGSGYQYSKDNGITWQSLNVFGSLAAGSYSIVVKGGDGCVGAPSMVTLTQPASLSVSASGGGAGCAGSTLSLSSTITGGTSPYTYSWSNSGGLSSGTVDSPTATIGSFGSHTLTVTDANLCTATSGAVTITNNSPAAPTVTTPAAICQGQPANLNATSSGNSINWYTQSTGGTAITTLVNSGTNYSVSPNTTTTYYAEAVGTSSGTPQTVPFTSTGADQTWIVPVGVYSIDVKMWGAGGAGSRYNATYISSGGPGGYVSGSLNVTPGQVLNLVVGSGGKVYPNAGTSQYGGGGASGVGTGYNGGGGGRSAIQFFAGTDVVTVGGGGGAGPQRYDAAGNNAIGLGYGGAGGGNSGGSSSAAYFIGAATGGTQSAGGTNTGSDYNGGSGSQYLGGTGSTQMIGGGGGGGGYYGGAGGGVGYWNFGANSNAGGGGGGSSYVANLTGTVVNTQGTISSTGAQAAAPNAADANYITGVGIGGAGGTSNNGGNGLIVISYSQPVAGCVSATRTAVTVTVNTAPTADAGSAMAAICSGSTSAALGGSVGGSATGGTWTHNGTGSIANASNPSTATYTAGAGETGTVTLTLTTSGGGCTAVTATKTIVVNANPAAPTAPVNLTICNAGTGSISVTAPTFTSSQNVAFNIATEPTETNAAPGNQIATATISALPTGTTITSAALTVNNLTALGNSYMSEVRLGLSGAVTYAAVPGSSTSTAGAFNYSSSVSSGFQVNTASTSLNLLYWDSSNDVVPGADCTFGAPKTANLTLNYSYPATINWYDASTGGNLLGTGASFDPIGTSVLPNTNTAGNYNFYAAAVNNGCESSRILVTVTVNAPVTAGIIDANQTICSGATPAALTSTTAGTGSGTITYEWQTNASGTYATILGQTSDAYAPSALTATTSYQRRTKSVSGGTTCYSGYTTAVTITVNAPVTAGTIGTNQTICSGATPTALTSTTAGTGSGTVTYEWQTNASGSYATISGETGATYAPAALTATTSYQRRSVSLSGGTTCYSGYTSAVTITVNAPATAGAIAADQTICSGATPAALTSTTAGTGSGSVTYEWQTNASGTYATISGETGATYAPPALTATTSYQRRTVSLSGGTTCYSDYTTAVTITVNALPTAVTVSGGGAICSGTSATLTASNGSSGTIYWQNTTTGGTSTSTASTSQSVSAAGTYYFRAQSVEGCWGTEGSATVTVNPLPTASISGAVGVCVNATTPNITFTGASGTAPYTFTYNINGGSNQTVTTSTGNTVTVAAPTSSGGTFAYNLVSVQDASSTTCSQAQSGTATVTVTTAPNAGAITGTQTICSNGTTTFTTDGNTGGTWTSGTQSVATINASTGVITPVSAGTSTVTYTLTGTGGCSNATATRTVTVNAVPSTPTVTVLNNCNGTSTLSTTTTGTLLWSTSETTSPITVTTAGTYTVTQTVNGCTSAAGSGVAAPKSTPVTPIVSVVNACGQSTLSFTPAANATILWSNNATTASTTTVNSETLTVVQTVNGCPSSSGSGSAVPLVIPSAPTVTAAQNFCVTDNATIASLAYTNVAGNTYTWYDAATAGNTVATSTQLPTATTTYYLSVSGSNGCTSTTRTAVAATESAQALATVSITGTTVCAGGEILFSATPVNGGPSPTYQWYNGGVPISGVTGSTYSATGLVEGAVITVKMIPSGSCVTVCPN